MANHKSIQILRGTRQKIIKNNESQSLLDGQLLYNFTDNYLSVGGGDSGNDLIKDPIACKELKGFSTPLSENENKTEYDYEINYNVESGKLQYKDSTGIFTQSNIRDGLTGSVISVGTPDDYSGDLAGDDTYWLDNQIEGNSTIALGRGLRQTGTSSKDNVLLGYKSQMLNSCQRCSILGGSQNSIDAGKFSTIVSGANNKITGTYAEAGGSGNTVKSYLGFVRGINNYIGVGHTAVSILGQNNTASDKGDGRYQYGTVILGRNNTLNYNGLGTIVAGYGLDINDINREGDSEYYGRIFLGKFNKWFDEAPPNSKRDPDGYAAWKAKFDDQHNVLLTVGNGTGSAKDKRKNAFEIMANGTFRSYATVDDIYQVGFKTETDGRAKVMSAPIENNDVIRLQEFDSISKHLSYYDSLDYTLSSKLNVEIDVTFDSFHGERETRKGSYSLEVEVPAKLISNYQSPTECLVLVKGSKNIVSYTSRNAKLISYGGTFCYADIEWTYTINEDYSITLQSPVVTIVYPAWDDSFKYKNVTLSNVSFSVSSKYSIIENPQKTGYIVVFTSNNNQQTNFPTTPYNTPHTIPIRNGNGNFQVGEVLLDYECANKKYVDERIAENKGEEWKTATVTFEPSDNVMILNFDEKITDNILIKGFLVAKNTEYDGRSALPIDSMYMANFRSEFINFNNGEYRIEFNTPEVFDVYLPDGWLTGASDDPDDYTVSVIKYKKF